MAAPDLRNDFDSVSLRRLAKRTRDATQSRRLLALAEYDGGSRTDRGDGVGLQTRRLLRFSSPRTGRAGWESEAQADHRRALAEVVEAGPVAVALDPDGVTRLRQDLGAAAPLRSPSRL